MSADTRLFDRPADLTPEEAAAAAARVLGAAGRREPRWPSRWPRYPQPAADNTAGGDLAAWLARLGEACDHDRAAAADPDRYGRQFR